MTKETTNTDNVANEVTEEENTIKEDSVERESSEELTTQDLLEALKNSSQETMLLKDQLLRKSADFENYKKRADKEKIEHLTYANEKLITEILTVVDNLERAIHHTNSADDEGAGIKNLQEGVEMTLKSFYTVLEKFGLTPINAIGEKFDPNIHEALQEEESEEFESGFVIKELQKGFTLNDRLLRPTIVVIAK